MQHFLILNLGTPNRRRGILEEPAWTCPPVFNGFNFKLLQILQVNGKSVEVGADTGFKKGGRVSRYLDVVHS